MGQGNSVVHIQRYSHHWGKGVSNERLHSTLCKRYKLDREIVFIFRGIHISGVFTVRGFTVHGNVKDTNGIVK